MSAFLSVVGPNKVRVSSSGVLAFNRAWPGSKLRPDRAYWFEFDDFGNLTDTDTPEHDDDGPEAIAMADDCKAWLFDDIAPAWGE